MAKLNYAKASRQWKADNYGQAMDYKPVKWSKAFKKERKAKAKAWKKKHPKAAKARQYYAADKQDRTSKRYWSWSRAVLKRDKYRCQGCNSADNLIAHHVKSWYDYPQYRFHIENGQTLCRDCHILIHPFIDLKRFKELQTPVNNLTEKVVIRRTNPRVI